MYIIKRKRVISTNRAADMKGSDIPSILGTCSNTHDTPTNQQYKNQKISK